MRKVIYSMMVSLDGFMESPHRDLNWVIVDDEVHQFVNDQQQEIGAYLYGRRLYEVMASYWPTADANPSTPAVEVEFARIWQRMPKIVFSTTLERVEGNSRLVRGDLAGEIARLKAEPGKDLDIGGATLAAAAMRLGLIDEYGLFIQPVILGGGTPFFPTVDASIKTHLVETRTFSSGVVYLRYRVAERE